MRNKTLLNLCVAAAALICAASSWAQDEARFATNPNIWADVPDMAILRVGDTYYMSSTTMHLSPGLPIMKSKNLVDWDIVSYAYDILDDVDSLALRNGQNAYGNGSWASSLRYHDGLFYVSTFASNTGKTHIYTTRDPEKEPWKARSFRPMLHDSSLFFDDDGKKYMLTGAGDLRLVELKDDLSGIKPDGFNDIVIHDVCSVAGGPGLGEGSQMFKKDGKYYVCNITWPRGDMRTQVIHRADKITGPYEGRVILHDLGVAQGTLVDTPNGKWYAYLFQDCGAVGRIPFLIPVEWEDGWPVLGVDGKIPMTLNIKKTGTPMGNLIASDEFDWKLTTEMPLAWQWNHNPLPEYWSTSERPGWLRLTSSRVDKSFVEARNSLTQRTFGPECSATTLLDASGLNDGDRAGLGALQQNFGFIAVKKEGGKYFVVMENVEGEQASAPIETSKVYLRIDCDFRDRRDEARFYWSLDGENWEELGKTLKMLYTLPHFMGYRFTLFEYATETPGGRADFDFYHVSPEN
ncbi:MAG: glycosyl hydrolase 43 family protein [Thermoguttaceae bacterium]|nr:glycosyl hydrolase 43 family protein [Thermoguttaceae bacterium]